MWARTAFRYASTTLRRQSSQLTRARWRPVPISKPPEFQYRSFAHGKAQQNQYQRFKGRGNIASNVLLRWAARPTFYYEVGGVAGLFGVFYIYNLETVPLSGRRRFNIISASALDSASSKFRNDVLSEYTGRVLPPQDARTQLVQRVLDRLIPNSGLPHAAWEVYVINSDEKNAFVVPGGKVFVFTGILPVCAGEDGLAAVLGHEIAHCYANHQAEKMSKTYVFAVPLQLLAYTFGIDPGLTNLLVSYGYDMPGSRTQESEADYIGLLIMAESCYDPAAAVGLWQRMGAAERGRAPPQFMSTHPSPSNREHKIREWLPDAMRKYEEGACGGTASLYDGFRQVVGGVKGDAW